MTQAKLDEALDMFASQSRDWLKSVVERWCESPIEALFLAALASEWSLYNPPSHEVYPHERYSFACQKRPFLVGNSSYAGADRYVIPQYEVVTETGDYRLDLAVFTSGYMPSDPWLKFAVELDGHDFHERTKSQVRRDKARDRTLQAAGWRVFRFAGSEVFEDASDCAYQLEEAMVAIINAYDEVSA